MDAGTPALTGGAAAPPPKKRRTDAADSAAQPAADGTQTKPHQGPTAAAEPTAGGGSGGAKETKNQKKRRGIRSNSSSSGSGKTFIFGNYDAYYRYRGAASADPSQSGDPRLQLLQRSWFEGRSVLDIGCNSGVITFAMAEQFAPSSILGVDIDGHLISRAQGRLARLRQAAVMTASAQAAGAAAAAAAAGGGSASAADGSTAAAPATESAPTGYPYNLEFRAENFVAKKHRQKQKKAAAKAAAAQAAPAAVGTAAAKPSGGGGGGPVKPVYGVILCLSVTKWIHLNWGDAGIKTLFRRVWESLPTDGTVSTAQCNRPTAT